MLSYWLQIPLFLWEDWWLHQTGGHCGWQRQSAKKVTLTMKSVWMRRLCVGVCTRMLSHVHLQASPVEDACRLTQSPGDALLKSEVYIILIMVYYIFPINIIILKRRVNVFKNKFVSFFICIVSNVHKGSSVSLVIVPFNIII